MLQRDTCGTWPVLPRQRSCGWRDETLCSTPLARKGRLLRHLCFSSPDAAQPILAEKTMSRVRLQAHRAQRGLPLTLSRQDYIAWPFQEKKNAAATGSRPCGCQGYRVERNVPPACLQQECWRSSREDWPAGVAAHSPTVKDRSNNTGAQRPTGGVGVRRHHTIRQGTPALPGASVPVLHAQCLRPTSTLGKQTCKIPGWVSNSPSQRDRVRAGVVR